MAGKPIYFSQHAMTGMIEAEPPWIKTASDYPLQKNVTFQVDTFVTAPGFGVRWETGAAITGDGYEAICHPAGNIYAPGF